MCKDCKDCKEINIPIGPQGPAGTNGTNGTNGAPGTNGTNGVDGTNAFKFVKQVTFDEIEQTIIITQAELTNCGVLPTGCLASETLHNAYTDLHIQVYGQIGSPISFWIPFAYRTDTITAGVNTYRSQIRISDGRIEITLDNYIGIVRVVILG